MTLVGEHLLVKKYILVRGHNLKSALPLTAHGAAAPHAPALSGQLAWSPELCGVGGPFAPWVSPCSPGLVSKPIIH